MTADPLRALVEKLQAELHPVTDAYSYTPYEEGRIAEKRRCIRLLSDAALSQAGVVGGEQALVDLFNDVYEREWDRAADEADDRKKALMGQADDHATRMAIRALLAAAPAAQTAASCTHSDLTPEMDWTRCNDCGWIRAGYSSGWGIASGKWFASVADLKFYRQHGRLPEPVNSEPGPTLVNPYTGQPRDYRDVDSDPEGILCVAPGVPLRPAPAAAPAVVVDEARPLEDWHEDDGFVVWWKFPVDEPSYIGSPLCDDWPGYHTHWTPHPKVPTIAAALGQEVGRG